MGLEPVTFTGGASDEDIGKELHGDFFVAHTPAALASSPARVEGEGGGGQARALGLFGGGVEFADQIVHIEVEERGGARGLRKWRCCKRGRCGLPKVISPKKSKTDKLILSNASVLQR